MGLPEEELEDSHYQPVIAFYQGVGGVGERINTFQGKGDNGNTTVSSYTN